MSEEIEYSALIGAFVSTKIDRTTQLSRTGFMDLPPELRLMCYEYFLPADRVMSFPISEHRRAEKTIMAACANPQIEGQLMDLVYTKCEAHIMVTPDKEMDLPAIEWNRFQSIAIKSDYHQTQPWNWPGMTQLISRLTYGWPKILPPITVLFIERDESPFLGDYKWIQDMPPRTAYRWRDSWDPSDNEESYTQYADPFDEDRSDEEYDPEDHESEHVPDPDDKWLRTSNNNYKNPLVIEILDYFLELPPCESAVVWPIFGLDYRRYWLPRHDPEQRIFDGDYMEDMCCALELWLQGERDGVELPRSESEDYGEPRLEQIAYQRRKGGLYCDGHESADHYWREKKCQPRF